MPAAGSGYGRITTKKSRVNKTKASHVITTKINRANNTTISLVIKTKASHGVAVLTAISNHFLKKNITSADRSRDQPVLTMPTS